MQLSGVVKWIESIITYLSIYLYIFIFIYIYIYIFILCNYVLTNLTNDGITYIMQLVYIMICSEN